MLYAIGRTRKNQVAETASIPPPVGGWNVRDALANMDEKDAVILKNWFPRPSDVMVRQGYTQHVTGISGQVESLMPYNTPTTEQLFGAAGTAFYNVTNSGAVGAAVQSGLANARWESVNFTTVAGNFLYAVNGSDKPRVWDGSTWTSIDSVSTPSFIGTTSSNLSNVTAFKQRLWFVEKDSLRAWFLASGAIGGTASQFDLSAFAKRGGTLVSIEGLTIDAGQGVDDYLIFATSEGEIIIYQGTDPASATTFAMRGRWVLGSPVGKRCLSKFAGDLLYICFDGLVPLSSALQSSRVNPKVALTDKINGAMDEATTLYGANFGWQTLIYPKGAMLLLNVPVSEGSAQQQYAMNTITGSWGQFTGVAANCWALFQDEPYFGGNGFVGQFWDGFADNSTNIESDAEQAFNYFGLRGQRKHFKQARPVFLSDGSPAITANINVDYSTNDPTGTLSFTATSYAVWDTAVWDTDVWGGGLSVLLNWQKVTGIGTCAAMRMKTASMGIELHWMATDYVYEEGGVIG